MCSVKKTRIFLRHQSRARTKAAKLKREKMQTGNRGITTAPLTEMEKKIVSLIGVEYTFGSDCPDFMPEEELMNISCLRQREIKHCQHHKL
ncbi:unnamed protein product [Parnassius mnemosyne]|uniref:Uncharacterized protein n=1 Tax=Parnassius mnemosyne TaxID=213953 RepID=A0AAV1LAN8_9NEOP